MNYKVRNDKLIEIPTDVVIAEGSKDTLKALQRHLNFGGGFDGWTPAFFLNRFVVNMENN